MTNFKWGLFASIAAVFISVILGLFAGVNALYIFIRALIFGFLFFGLGFGLRFVINSFFPELLFSGSDDYSGQDEQGSQVNITLDSTGEYAVPELFRTSGDSEELGNIEELISGVFRSRSDDGGGQRSSKTGAAIDRKSEAGYNDRGMFDVPEMKDDGFDASDEWGGMEEIQAADKPAFESREAGKQEAYHPQFTTNFGEESGLESLPDLDSMARAFSGFGGSPDAGASAAAASAASPAQVFVPTQPAAAKAEESEPDRSQYVGNKPQPLQGDFDPKDMAKGISTILSKDR